MQDGDRLFAAGIVAAGAAVQLVCRLYLAHLTQRLGYLGLGRVGQPLRDYLKLLMKSGAIRLLDFKILLSGIARDGSIVTHRRAVDFSITGPPIQLPTQADISIKHPRSEPLSISRSAAMQFSVPSIAI